MIVGLDEAGRGAWAGPIVASAVLIGNNFSVAKLNDSKKLSRSCRENLATQIKRQALQIGIGWVTAEGIDKIGLGAANRLAMNIALNQISKHYDRILVDGNIKYVDNCETVVGGDITEPAISAASIIAKVSRDKYMQSVELCCRGFSYSTHFGYGTARHKTELQQYGVTSFHRRSFRPVGQMQLI